MRITKGRKARKRAKATKRVKGANAATTLAARRVIKVPRTPAGAFNASRRPSALLLAQIEHLQWAALPASERAPGTIPPPDVKTEGEAAERIGNLTKAVLAANGKPTPTPRPRTARSRRKK
jgi:hypothetical protein